MNEFCFSGKNFWSANSRVCEHFQAIEQWFHSALQDTWGPWVSSWDCKIFICQVMIMLITYSQCWCHDGRLLLITHRQSLWRNIGNCHAIVSTIRQRITRNCWWSSSGILQGEWRNVTFQSPRRICNNEQACSNSSSFSSIWMKFYPTRWTTTTQSMLQSAARQFA